jgi:hypothetical protein
MTDDDSDHYELDGQGCRVLVGLTAQETAEFIRLDEMEFVRPPPLSQQDWLWPEERRWLELFEKHRQAMEPFLAASKTKH